MSAPNPQELRRAVAILKALGLAFIYVPGDKWAAIDLLRDDVRFPDARGMDRKTVEQFLEAREREPVFCICGEQTSAAALHRLLKTIARGDSCKPSS